MAETLAHGYASDSTQGELSNEYQHDRGLDGSQKSLHPCALDKKSLSIGGVNYTVSIFQTILSASLSPNFI